MNSIVTGIVTAVVDTTVTMTVTRQPVRANASGDTIPSGEPISENVGFELPSGSGTGDALTSATLAQFAPTTSAQFRGVLTDETGSGAAVFGTAPTITSPVGLVKADVGLDNVNNTADASKPVSTAQAAADAAVLASAVQRANHTGTQLAATISDFAATAASAAPVQTVAGRTGTVVLVKGDVGLGAVDNVADASKPVSTAQQTALDLKANLASPTFTGLPLSTTPAPGNDTTRIATTAFVVTALTGIFRVMPTTGSPEGVVTSAQFGFAYDTSTERVLWIHEGADGTNTGWVELLRFTP